jgi:hypothetical protein
MEENLFMEKWHFKHRRHGSRSKDNGKTLWIKTGWQFGVGVVGSSTLNLMFNYPQIFKTGVLSLQLATNLIMIIFIKKVYGFCHRKIWKIL